MKRSKVLYRVSFGVAIFLVILAALCFTASQYKVANFKDAKIDEVLFLVNNGIDGSKSDSAWEMIITNLPKLGLLSLLFIIPLIDWFHDRIRLLVVRVAGRRRKTMHEFNPSHVRLRYKLLYAAGLVVWGGWTLATTFGVPEYITALNQSSQIYEQNYVDPSKAELIFPSNKRNLIYIYLESMENTITGKSAGGRSNNSIIPELEMLARNNVNFSHTTSGIGGAQPAVGTTWTTAGMTAQSTGVPLKETILNIGRNDSSAAINKFLPGAYGLGDILKKQGYNQTFVMGSDARFGGRDKLLVQHGGYDIKDFENTKATGRIPQDYKVWWGYEDKKLFAFAKEEATNLAKKDAPFNLQLLTVDTHFTDGWLDPTCTTEHTRQYDNVFACSSKQVGEFVDWVRRQPFAANTTIVISGDHLGMQTPYYEEYIGTEPYTRTIYHTFINPAIAPINTKNRQFTTMDMYPSTLAAMGVTIRGERLGLGTNLFSEKQTLLEQMGSLQALNDELAKRSSYYERRIFNGQ